MTHEEEVAFVMGEVAARAMNPLPLTREIRPRALERMADAEHHTRPHEPVSAGRLGRVRRMFVRLFRDQFERQATFNGDVLLAMRDVEALTTIIEERLKTGWVNLDYRLGATQGDVQRIDRGYESGDRSLAATIASLDARLNALEGASVMGEADRADIDRRIGEITSAVEAQRGSLAMLRASVDAAIRRIAERSGVDAESARVEEVATEMASLVDEVYLEFEDLFRGSRDDVTRKLTPYLNDVRGVLTPNHPALDLGSGRGEWLALLRKEGLRGYGVETNPAMVKASDDQGLEVVQADAIAHLASLEPGSIGAITAFHLVEHLPFDALIRLVDLALAALVPGGVLILETPNPSNLVVGSNSFWLDPTHIRPIPGPLLEFVTRSRGLTQTELRYLHPVREGWPPSGSEPMDPLREEIAWYLLGPQDYAVVGRKATHH